MGITCIVKDRDDSVVRYEGQYREGLGRAQYKMRGSIMMDEHQYSMRGNMMRDEEEYSEG
jgi:hypothetical protein